MTHAHTTAEYQALDRAHYLHPFTDHAALARRGSRVVERAEGVWLWDSDGRRILDGMAGLWCVNLGYGRAELVEAARAQLERLPYYNSFFQSAHPPAIELAAELARLAPGDLDHAFFTNSGSEASDTVVRMVRRYWALRGEPRRDVIVSRHNAYHGSTMGGASLGGMAPIHAQGGLPIPGIEHVDEPYWYKHGGDLTPDEFGLAAARSLELRIQQLGPERVAAFIGEPIQGAGGVIVPPASYWPEIQRICRKYGVLLVVDEVICGFGRTGRWFGSDYYQVQPDLMPIAKGLSSGYLPIGAVMVAADVAATLIDQGGEFHHGFTYSGHPAACAVALENLRILGAERIVERVGEDTGPYFQQRLAELADHPLVGEVRGVGLIAAIQLAADKASRKLFDEDTEAGIRCREHSLEQGLMMRAANDSMLLSPPLVITREEIDELVLRARTALDLTARDLGR